MSLKQEICAVLELENPLEVLSKPTDHFVRLVESRDVHDVIRSLLLVRDKVARDYPAEREELVGRTNAIIRDMRPNERRVIQESSIVYHHFMTTTPYPNAGNYRSSKVPLRTAEDILGPGMKIQGVPDRLQENKPNGAIQHYWHYLQATPYPVAGQYPRKKKKDKKKDGKLDVGDGIEAIGIGEDPEDIVDDLLK